MYRESLKPTASVPDSDRFNSIHYAIHLRKYFLDVMNSKTNSITVNFATISYALDACRKVFSEADKPLTPKFDLSPYKVTHAPLILIQQGNFQFLLQIENKNDSVIINYKGNRDPKAGYPPSVSFVQEDVFEKKSFWRTTKPRPAK